MFKLLGAPGSGRFAWLKHPVVSNTVFGIVLRGIGDSIQQRIELSSTHDKKKSDAIKNEKQIAAQTTTPGFSWTRMSILNRRSYRMWIISSLRVLRKRGGVRNCSRTVQLLLVLVARSNHASEDIQDRDKKDSIWSAHRRHCVHVSVHCYSRSFRRI